MSAKSDIKVERNLFTLVVFSGLFPFMCLCFTKRQGCCEILGYSYKSSLLPATCTVATVNFPALNEFHTAGSRAV